MAADSTSADAKRGPSRPTMILLGLVTLVVILCCGGGIFLFTRFRMETTNVPAEIAAIADEIMTVDIPPSFSPHLGIDTDIVIYKSKAAIYSTASDKSQLFLLSIDVNIGKGDLAQARAEMQKQGPVSAELENPTTETIPITLDGVEYPVTFSTGILKAAEQAPKDQVGKECYSVEAVFAREEGMVIYSSFGPIEEYDRDAIEKSVRSIKLSQPEKK